MNREKIRVNITVDKNTLEKAKKKLHLFGGKLSTLFNSYLEDFVESIDKKIGEDQKILAIKVEEIEKRLKKIEENKSKEFYMQTN